MKIEERENAVYVLMDKSRIWYDKKDESIKIILSDLNEILTIKKGTPQYNRLLTKVNELREKL
jgi:uncharacterized RmlC-like cupin family protein